jgi:hypothetical protein
MNPSSFRPILGVARCFVCIALGCGTWGCAGPQDAQPAASPASVSYDGRYVGTVQVTGAAAGFSNRDCETDPQFTIDVRGNKFTYTQAHSNIAGTSPSLTASSTTSTYSATIASAGTITGDSGDLNGMISGSVVGTHMAGRISGFVCYYTFAADRS